MSELLNVKVDSLEKINEYFSNEVKKLTGENYNLFDDTLEGLEKEITFVEAEDCTYNVPGNNSTYKNVVRMSGLWLPDDRFNKIKEAIDYFFDDCKAKTISQLQFNLLVKDLESGKESATMLENRDTIHIAFVSLGGRITKSFRRSIVSIIFQDIEYYIVKVGKSIYFMVNDETADLSIKKSFEEFGFINFIDKDFDELVN